MINLSRGLNIKNDDDPASTEELGNYFNQNDTNEMKTM